MIFWFARIYLCKRLAKSELKLANWKQGIKYVFFLKFEEVVLDILEEGRAAGKSEGIQIGAEHEQRLTKSLLKDNRIDDLKRALDDPAFRQKLLEEYGID